jgi:ABC-type uncharacterized transport system substrate-binding protein
MADHGVACSMSRSGNVWDNADTESFFSSLKTERDAALASSRADNNLDIDAAFASLPQKRVDALLVATQVLFATRLVQLVTLAARHAVPTMYPSREFVEAGGLMSYGSSINDRERQLGVYIGRILKGEKPAEPADSAGGEVRVHH